MKCQDDYTCTNHCKCGRCGKPADMLDDIGHFAANSAYWNGPNPRDIWDNQIMCRSCWVYTKSSTGER